MDNIAILLYQISFIISIMAIILGFIRFLLGPTTADRAVALDAMTVVGIALIIFVAWFAARVIYIDVAMVYALLSFLGVIAMARYLEGGL